MFYPPQTRAEAEAYRYYQWAGNSKGNDYRPSQCAYEVPVGGRSPLFRQCVKPPGHGPDGLYCKQHAKRADRST